MERYFHIERTEDPEKLKSVYNLRYQVFCKERGFIPKRLCPKQMEVDEYDNRSLHFAAYYNKDQHASGTLRLVSGEAVEQLPLSKKCQIDKALLPRDFDYSKCGEISRLAISKNFRRRATDGNYPQEKEDRVSARVQSNKRTKFPEIVLGLYKSLYQETKRHGIEHWLAAMEPSLVKLLYKLPIQFMEIGPEVDYYGPVKPYIASVYEFECMLHTRSPELYADFANGLDTAYVPVFDRPLS
jgi:N-acyl amino acid synthase of PEP-CTERM/exosortase system